MSFSATVDLLPGPSLRLLKIGSTVHVVALALLPFAAPAGWPMAVLALGIAGSWFWLRRHPALGFGPAALTRLTWHAEGHWTLHDVLARSHNARLRGDSLRHPMLLVLRFRLDDGSTRTRLIGGDELPSDPLRRLRARLSVWRESPVSAEPPSP